MNVPLGPAGPALFPAASVAVPAAIEIPSVPSPVVPEIVTVRVAVPVPLTAIMPVAVPVVFSVMFVVASAIAATPLPPESAKVTV
jgi:hypothetical protein